MNPGRLIVIEGLDGAGTTTQAKRVAIHLGATSHLTREPSDGPIGRLIRDMLAGDHQIHLPPHSPGSAAHPGDPGESLTRGKSLARDGAGVCDGAMISQSTFSLLFAADRLDHLQREVEPALAVGKTVISDRWYHSSLAYQGTGAERDWISALNARARRPELTIFLEVRPEVAAKRRATAKRRQELFEDLQMQIEVDAGYRATIAELRAAGERIECIDGEMPEDAVFAAIVRLIG